MPDYTAIGSLLLDAYVTRIETLLPAIPILYRGQQASASDYILIAEADDRYSPFGSDKDGRANDYVTLLEFWGVDPRTVTTNAKTVVDSVIATPLSFAGFYFLRSVVERHALRPALTIEGQANQFAWDLQIRFFYHPNP